jgi:hypothetical protein
MMVSTLSGRALFRCGRDGLLIEQKMGLPSRLGRRAYGINGRKTLAHSSRGR